MPVSSDIDLLLNISHHLLDFDFFSQVADDNASEIIINQPNRQNEFLVVSDFVELVLSGNSRPGDIIFIPEAIFEVPQFVFAALEETLRLSQNTKLQD